MAITRSSRQMALLHHTLYNALREQQKCIGLFFISMSLKQRAEEMDTCGVWKERLGVCKGFEIFGETGRRD